MSAYVTIQTEENIIICIRIYLKYLLYMHVKRTNTEAHRSEMIYSECRSGLPYSYTYHPGPRPRHPRGYAGRICTYHRR